MRRPIALALVVLAAAPAAAEAKRFGANLNLSANAAFSCSTAVPYFNGNSCLMYNVEPKSTGYAPFSGVLTKVRVRTGNSAQGPMRIVILRSYYQNNLSDPGHPNFFCCFVQRYGPKFRPGANGITTVKTTIGMVEDPTPSSNDGNTVAKGDFLALAVLSGNTRLPVHKGRNGYTAFYGPAPRPGNPPAPSPNPIGGNLGAYPGFTLLISAEIDPVDRRRSMQPGLTSPMAALLAGV